MRATALLIIALASLLLSISIFLRCSSAAVPPKPARYGISAAMMEPVAMELSSLRDSDWKQEEILSHASPGAGSSRELGAFVLRCMSFCVAGSSWVMGCMRVPDRLGRPPAMKLRVALFYIGGLVLLFMLAAVFPDAPPTTMASVLKVSTPLVGVACNSQGNFILTAAEDGSIDLWKSDSGWWVKRWKCPGDAVATSSGLFDPLGEHVLAGCEHTAVIWNLRAGKEQKQLVGHTDVVTSVAFSPDGKQVLTGSNDRTARLWDVSTGKEQKRLVEHKDVVTSVAFSPDGKQALTGSRDRTARLWDVSTGKKQKRLVGHTDTVSSVAFSPDGKQVLTGSSDRTARLWDVSTGKEQKRLVGHKDVVSSVAFSPDGKQVLTGSWDQTTRLWDVSTGKEQKRLVGHEDRVSSVAFSPDGKQVLTGSNDRAARLWDVSTGKEQKRRVWRKEQKRLVGHEDRVSSVAFSPDGKQVLTGSWDKTAMLWDVSTGKEQKQFEGHTSEVTSVAFSPDGKQVLTGSWDESAMLWKRASSKILHVYGSLMCRHWLNI